jgi:putative transposase
MQWLLTSHGGRYHKHYGGSGLIWQGRFKSFPVQRDEHLMTVLRYLRQNPVRAGSSSTVQEWLWSSVRRRHLVDRSPVDEAGQWSEQLKNQLGDAQVANIRECLNRPRPFGQSNW